MRSFNLNMGFLHLIQGIIMILVSMVLQYKKVGPWKDYLYGERVYMVLSLLAKSVRSWLIFTGRWLRLSQNLMTSRVQPTAALAFESAECALWADD